LSGNYIPGLLRQVAAEFFSGGRLFRVSCDAMRYLGAYRFLFEHPKWGILLLIGAVCQFVPLVGPVVLMGYIYSVIEAKHRHGDAAFPDFDFNQLGAYLTRGVWPFLAAIVAALPLMILLVPAFFGMFFLQVASARTNEPPVAGIILIVLCGIAFGLLSIVWQFATLPIILRAGLSQDFGTAFSMEFARDFLSRVWKEMLLSVLFLLVTAPFVILGGLLLFCIGIYAAAVVMTFAHYHLQYQIYELYLQRGGTPIPLKEPATGN